MQHRHQQCQVAKPAAEDARQRNGYYMEKMEHEVPHEGEKEDEEERGVEKDDTVQYVGEALRTCGKILVPGSKGTVLEVSGDRICVRFGAAIVARVDGGDVKLLTGGGATGVGSQVRY